LFSLPVWLAKGRAHLKRAIAERVHIDVGSLPTAKSFLSFLKKEARPRAKAVARHRLRREVCEAGCAHVGIFSSILASDGRTNLSGANKARAILATPMAALRVRRKLPQGSCGLGQRRRRRSG